MFRSQRPAPLSLAVQAASLAALAAMLLVEWRDHGRPPPPQPCLCAQPRPDQPARSAHLARPARTGAAPAIPVCSPSGAAS